MELENVSQVTPDCPYISADTHTCTHTTPQSVSNMTRAECVEQDHYIRCMQCTAHD